MTASVCCPKGGGRSWFSSCLNPWCLCCLAKMTFNKLHFGTLSPSKFFFGARAQGGQLLFAPSGTSDEGRERKERGGEGRCPPIKIFCLRHCPHTHLFIFFGKFGVGHCVGKPSFFAHSKKQFGRNIRAQNSEKNLFISTQNPWLKFEKDKIWGGKSPKIGEGAGP